jgi:hypothetical protein
MMFRSVICMNSFLGERKAHPRLGARAEDFHVDMVVITRKHVNRTAPSGWMVRLVRILCSCSAQRLSYQAVQGSVLQQSHPCRRRYTCGYAYHRYRQSCVLDLTRKSSDTQILP